MTPKEELTEAFENLWVTKYKILAEYLTDKELNIEFKGIGQSDNDVFVLIRDKKWKYPASGVVSQMMLTFLPPTNEILSHSSWTGTEFRHKGIGTLMHRMRLEAVQSIPYVHPKPGLIMCSVRDDNQNQIKILTRFEWSRGYSYSNRAMWFKTL